MKSAKKYFDNIYGTLAYWYLLLHGEIGSPDKKSLRVGIDLDGVCYDFADSFRAFLVYAGIRTPDQCPEPQRWEFYEDWGFSLEEFIDLCHDGVNEGIIFSHGTPHHGVKEAFDMIRAAGHSIHIITDRSFGRDGGSERATRAWLDGYGLKFDSLTFTRDKTIVNVDVMVDDKIENYDALSAAGVKTYLLARPWNFVANCNRLRIPSLLNYAEVVTNG